MDFLEKSQKEIDEIDDKLVELLEKRFEIVNRVINFKKKNGLEIEDKQKEEIIKARYLHSGLPDGFSDKFFNMLFDEDKKLGREF